MEHPLNQSATTRAFKDTIISQKTARFMWGGEGVFAVGGGAWLAQIAPSGASTLEMVSRSVLGGLGGLITTIFIIFAWNLFRAPYRQRNGARKLLKDRLEEAEKTSPKIEVKPRITNDRFILDIRNNGIDAEFNAKCRVYARCRDTESYTMYWESKNNINTSDFESILVAAISKVDDNACGLSENGLMLYKANQMMFGVSSLERKKLRSGFLRSYMTDKTKEREEKADEELPELEEIPKCVIEVNITSKPGMLESVIKSYALQVEYDHKFKTHQLKYWLSTPDKEGYSLE